MSTMTLKEIAFESFATTEIPGLDCMNCKNKVEYQVGYYFCPHMEGTLVDCCCEGEICNLWEWDR